MKISTDVIDHTNDGDEMFKVSSAMWVAAEATKMGFPIAGTVEEIYEDAVILIPPVMRFDWGPDRVKIGRVLAIQDTSTPMSFTILDQNGNQTQCMYGHGYSVYFALPEDSEEFARG